MQTMNFAPLDFGGIRQQELDARRRQREAYGNIARGLGSTGQQAFAAQAQWDKDQRAEEWRQRQWNRQRWQEEDERMRRVVLMETAYLPRRKDPRNTRMNPSPRNRNLLP